MNPKLSILVCRIPSRYYMWSKLQDELLRQIFSGYGNVEILSDDRIGITVGSKRNSLLQKASGQYVSFIDEDDRVSINYIDLLMEGIEKNVDCCSLKGIITTNGKDAHYFEHSIKYKAYKTNEGTSYELGQIHYERFPNHLSCIKSEIAKQFKFPEISYGEDTDWATQIFNSGLIKTEHEINEVLYYYDYISNKKII